MIKSKSINPVVLVLVVILLVSIGGYYLFGLVVMSQFKKSIVESVIKATKNENHLPEVLTDNKEHLYVGADDRNGIKIVNGIFFKRIDSISIKYEVSFLENWKMIDTISGIARLDIETVEIDNFFIQDRNNKNIAAYKFMDKNRKCELIIGITKNYKTSTIAKIFERYENTITELTPVLYYK